MAKMNGTLDRIPENATFFEDPTTSEEFSNLSYAT
jgi:hypothetical protein